MHVVLFAAVTRVGDPELVESRLLPLVERRVPMALHLPPPVLERLPEVRQADSIEWVRAGWGVPDPRYLPDELLAAAIRHEADLMQRLGVRPGAFWMVPGWTECRLPLVASTDPPCLLVEATTGNGVLAWFDRIAPALGVETPASVPAFLPAGDDVVVWRVPLERFGSYAAWVLQQPGCWLSIPSSYLADHPVRGRLRLPPPSPPTEERVERRIGRLSSLLPDRIPVEVVEACASAVGVDRPADEGLLVTARRLLDRAVRHESPSVTRLDWDADGETETELDTDRLDLVIDSRGRLLVFDHKEDGRALGNPTGEPPGMLCRYLLTDGTTPDLGEFTLRGVETSRSTAHLRMVADHIEIDVGLWGGVLELVYRFEGCAPGLAGPELPLALGRTRIRVDGSEWEPVDRPTARSGHRFRVRGEAGELLFTSPLPAGLFARPASSGVVCWLHWPVAESGRYELRVEVSPPANTERRVR